jgi:uncharacterized protein (TIGR03437 family)
MRFVLILITATLTIAGEFSTSLGDTYPRTISAIATDSAGNTYVVGSRQLGGGPYGLLIGGVSFSGITGLPSILSYGGSDVFVTKLDPNGRVLFTDTFAGKGIDTGSAIALDPSGNIYIAGTTTSNDFPLSKALQTQPSTSGTGFIIKLTNDGTTILYSTYFGGLAGMTSISAMTTDPAGNLYLTGYTSASDFPHTTGMPSAKVNLIYTAPDNPAISAAFVTALDSSGKILFSGTVGGTSAGCNGVEFCRDAYVFTTGVAIALDASRNVYFGGNTDATDFPTTSGAFLKKGLGAFAGKIAASGSGLLYLTFLGTGTQFSPLVTGTNVLSSLTVDSSGNAYLAGSTGDPSFPATAGTYQPKYAGAPLDPFGNPTSTDGFVAKLKPDGTGLVWATFLGSGTDAVNSVAVDAAGNVWASGTTASPSFPNKQGWSQGGDFLVEFNPPGSALSYSALYSTGTVAQSVALDPSGLVHLAGANGFVSAINPSSAPTMRIFNFQNAFGGDGTARISPAEVISIYGPNIGPATAAPATPTNGFYPTTFSGVQVQINGANIPLLYVSANQINAVVPMGIAPNASAIVRVINGTTVSPDYPVWIVTSAPQAFPAVLNQDGTINSKTNPAKGGSTFVFYATGWPSNLAAFADGQIVTYAQDSCVMTCQINATNGTLTATVTYGGVAPGIVAGVTQFNVQLGMIDRFFFPAGPKQIIFLLTGPASITQTVWVAP